MLQLDKDYFLLLIDVKNSTSHPSGEVQEKLEQTSELLTQLNQEFSDSIQLKLDLNYGDEIAGIFTTPADIFSVIKRIRRLFHPMILRTAVVKGKVARNSNDIRQVGGQIFKDANNYVNELKGTDRLTQWSISTTLNDQILNVLSTTIDTLIGGMTNNQYLVYLQLQEKKSQKKIAQQMKKAEQYVSVAKKAGHAELLMETEKTIQHLLEAITNEL